MRTLILVAAAVLAAATASAQATLSVGTATARPGESASGVITVPGGADPGTEIPVSVVQGAKPGPVLALVAGTHGYEYTSIVALPRVLAKLDPKRMAGAVILVHMANPPAFYERRIYRNVDGKNLNRVYPGNADGHPDRAHRLRPHPRRDRQGDPPRRHALRRRQRVALALLVLADHRGREDGRGRRRRWPSPTASTTS